MCESSRGLRNSRWHRLLPVTTSTLSDKVPWLHLLLALHLTDKQHTVYQDRKDTYIFKDGSLDVQELDEELACHYGSDIWCLFDSSDSCVAQTNQLQVIKGSKDLIIQAAAPRKSSMLA